MKEAFWGVLVVMLGLFGVVVVNVLQQVTVDNERVYYVLKESTEASTYESIDLGYYRLNGVYRIVEEKFIENLIERYSTNIVDAKDYTIIVHDINELPPFVSLRVESGISAIQNGFMKGNNNVNIVNAINGVIEAKYNLEELINFLGIIKEEWMEMTSKNNASDGNYCNELFDEESECINGDAKFLGWDVDDINSFVCYGDTSVDEEKEATAKYAVCECSKWVEEEKTIKTKPIYNSSDAAYVYTWVFNYDGELGKISDTHKEKSKSGKCVEKIDIMVPSDWETKKATGSDGDYTKAYDGTTVKSTSSSYYEPSKDNSSYSLCGDGIRIPVYRDISGKQYTSYRLHMSYNPTDAVNRNVNWEINNDYITLKNGVTQPPVSCYFDPTGANCLSKAVIKATDIAWNAVKDGSEVTSLITATSSNNITATCKVTLYNGYVEPSCESLTIKYIESGTMKSSYTPTNGSFAKLKWSISDENIATINSDTGVVSGKSVGSADVTITSYKKDNSVYKTATCTLISNGVPAKDIVISGNNGNTYIIYDYYRDTTVEGVVEYVKVAVNAKIENGKIVKIGEYREVDRANPNNPKKWDDFKEDALKLHDNSATKIPKTSKEAESSSDSVVKNLNDAYSAATAKKVSSGGSSSYVYNYSGTVYVSNSGKAGSYTAAYKAPASYPVSSQGLRGYPCSYCH